MMTNRYYFALILTIAMFRCQTTEQRTAA